MIAFLVSCDYESAVRGAVSLGGDADTQACIAGGIAEAYYREIPDHIRRFCNAKIDGTIKAAVREFCKQYAQNIPKGAHP
ncbi:MAG: ADP-ribosylglycohydrolase family protein [Clostridia bacterium]|nr:ADP-ribosylglycohydrolase family protein [Clostridia bacterium]